MTGQHVGLDAALQDGVARLLGDVAAQVLVAGGPLGLHDAVGGEGGGAEVADLARPLQVGQRRQGLLVAGARVPAVHLVEVDVVDTEAAQAVVEGGDQPAAGAALVVALVAHRHERLGGEHDVVAPSGDGGADHLLGLAAAVHVGRIDQVDPGVEGGVDDGGDLAGLVWASAPKFIAPRTSELTCTPVRPKVRYCTVSPMMGSGALLRSIYGALLRLASAGSGGRRHR